MSILLSFVNTECLEEIKYIFVELVHILCTFYVDNDLEAWWQRQEQNTLKQLKILCSLISFVLVLLLNHSAVIFYPVVFSYILFS